MRLRRFGLSSNGHKAHSVPSPHPTESRIELHELLPADVHSVGIARGAARRFAADLQVDRDGIVLAVSEAVANAVAHAYGDGDVGTVELSGSATPYEVTIEVRDHGHGLHGPSPHGAGFGLEIIRRLAQHVEVDDTTDGVALTMRFRRGGAWATR